MRYALILISCLLAFAIRAQTLQGRVVDAKTGSPIPYAHIRMSLSGEGTVSDEEGFFRLILKAKNAGAMFISCVGYETWSREISEHTVAYLNPAAVVLPEVVVSPVNPLKLLQDALQNIPRNHGGHRLLTCFYRHVAKKQDSYVHVSEAALRLNQHRDEYNQIAIIKAREIEDERAFNGVGMNIGTKIGAVRNMDLTMNADIHFLTPGNAKKYDYVYEGVMDYGGTEAHVISFDQKKGLRESLYTGKIYLSTETLAFIGFDYAFSAHGIQYLTVGSAAERAAAKLLNIDISLLSQRTVVMYRRYGTHWHVDNIVKYETARVKSRRYNFDVTVDERSDFLVTEIDTTVRKPMPKEDVRYHGFIEAASDSTHSFWNDINVIPTQIDYNLIAQEIDKRNGFTALRTSLKERMRDFPKDKAARVDSILTTYYNKGFFNGTALVRSNHHTIYQKGFGYANREKDVLNDTTTRFRIGSLSKSFTSYIILQLKNEGRLQYDDTVQQFIPWYPHHGITLRHLLTHASGIPNYTTVPDYLDSIHYAFSTEEIIRKFGQQKLLFPPGSDFSYSNTGYTLLACIAEKVSGKKFEQLLQDYTFKPLAMYNTALSRQNDAGTATGYLYGAAEPHYNLRNVLGAGGLTSNVRDLVLWDIAMDRPECQELFTPETWYADWGAQYAYGWMKDKFQFWVSKKHTILYHPGTDMGFKTMLARQPDNGNLVILLNNTGEFPLFDITDLILQVLN